MKEPVYNETRYGWKYDTANHSLHVPQEGAILCGKQNIILTPCDTQESN